MKNWKVGQRVRLRFAWGGKLFQGDQIGVIVEMRGPHRIQRVKCAIGDNELVVPVYVKWPSGMTVCQEAGQLVAA